MSSFREAFRYHWREAVAEALAVMLLTVSILGSPLLALAWGPVESGLRTGAVTGLTAWILIESPLGRRSGGHFNPALTIAFARLGRLRVPDAMLYVAAQVCGALLGAGVCRGACSVFPSLGASPVPVLPLPGHLSAFSVEVLVAAGVLGVAVWAGRRPRAIHRTGAIAAATIGAATALAFPLLRNGLNPARSIGLGIDSWPLLAVFVAAPTLGALVYSEGVRILGWLPHTVVGLNPNAASGCPYACAVPPPSTEGGERPPKSAG